MNIGFLTNSSLKQFGEYNTTTAGLYHPQCHLGCPNQCSNTWNYFDNGWHVERSINVSCGRN